MIPVRSFRAMIKVRKPRSLISSCMGGRQFSYHAKGKNVPLCSCGQSNLRQERSAMFVRARTFRVFVRAGRVKHYFRENREERAEGESSVSSRKRGFLESKITNSTHISEQLW